MVAHELAHLRHMDHSPQFWAAVRAVVPDLDAAITFHTDVLGWQLLHRERNEDQGVEEAMLCTGGLGAENAHIQLLAPLRPDSAIGKFITRNGPGLQQVAYRVADLDAVSATLRERGVRLLYDAPRGGTSGSRVNFVHPKDAGGVLVELVEPAAGSH